MEKLRNLFEVMFTCFIVGASLMLGAFAGAAFFKMLVSIVV